MEIYSRESSQAQHLSTVRVSIGVGSFQLTLWNSLTQATDTANLKLVFAAVKETILQNALKDACIIKDEFVWHSHLWFCKPGRTAMAWRRGLPFWQCVSSHGQLDESEPGIIIELKKSLSSPNDIYERKYRIEQSLAASCRLAYFLSS